MKSKYVAFGNIEAVLFPDTMIHSVLSETVVMRLQYRDTDRRSGPEGKFDIREATSAGFFRVYINDDGELDVFVYDKSESMNLTSKPEDALLIKRTLGIAS